MTTQEPFQLNLAPDRLWQMINPFFAGSAGDQVGLINISLGDAREDATERAILKDVGSYGRQIGHLAEALEVVVALLHDIAPDRLAALPQAHKDALAIALGDAAKVRQIKDQT